MAQQEETLIYYEKEIKEKKNIVFQKILTIFTVLTVSLVYLYTSVVTSIMPIVSPIAENYFDSLRPLKEGKDSKEIFGFAPYWTINKLDNVDFNTLTTLAYFGVPIAADGNLVTDSTGYDVFKSDKATEIFKRAHDNGTRVVLTVTQMDQDAILMFLDDPSAQQRAIDQTTDMVVKRGIDGINIDVEYVGSPDFSYQEKFNVFVKNMTSVMHKKVPGSRVTVSVLASSAKDPIPNRQSGQKLYDIKSLSQNSDGIFMMAYDFATTSSDYAIPTSPLYGHKEGKYWYDVSSAVEDFLKLMPAEKLILGLPWYGYNYPVNTPQVKAPRNPGYYTTYWYRWRKYWQFHEYSSHAQTYANAVEEITPAAANFQSGWDEYGQVGWKAHYDAAAGVWRMIFLEDAKSLGIKYDFAKEKNLGGVGMWALGFDEGKTDLWNVLREKFGAKLADSRVTSRQIE